MRLLADGIGLRDRLPGIFRSEKAEEKKQKKQKKHQILPACPEMISGWDRKICETTGSEMEKIYETSTAFKLYTKSDRRISDD